MNTSLKCGSVHPGSAGERVSRPAKGDGAVFLAMGVRATENRAFEKAKSRISAQPRTGQLELASKRQCLNEPRAPLSMIRLLTGLCRLPALALLRQSPVPR